jgi:hypothetical protein
VNATPHPRTTAKLASPVNLRTTRKPVRIFTRPATRRRVDELKANGEDYAFYPTTDEILAVIAKSIRREADRAYRRHGSLDILDIGAGDGRALVKLQEMLSDEGEHSRNTITLDQFAVEKSMIHLANMPKHIVVIGTEFHEQTLVDKQVDIVFCNPPYSEYEEWAYRILRECAAKSVYLVIPRRWRDSQKIQELIDQFELKPKSLGKFDFETADRRARAKVEIVLFDMGDRDKDSAFNSAIEEMLPELDKFDCKIDDECEEDKDWLRQVAKGGNIIESLVHAYDTELTEMYETYRKVVKINPLLLKELGVTKKAILDGLRSKIVGLKNKYWQVLFEHLEDITKRLATKQRNAFLESLRNKTVVDFTEGNVRSMLIWISKWASDHFDDQLVELFKSLAQHANVHRYKSNDKVFTKGNWRYLHEDETQYKIDYRLVIEGFGGINTSQYSFDAVNGLSRRSIEFLSDFVTVANNLGFACMDSPANYRWTSGKKNELCLQDGEPLMDAKAYQNGNLHIRVAKRVILAINVQAGKLLGWIRTAEEAVRELQPDPEDVAYVAEVFRLSNRIEPSNLLRIGHVA